MKRFVHRRRSAVLGAAAVLAAGAAVALAAGGIAGPPDPIQACAQKNSGALRVVETPGDCRPSEVAVSWNIQGPIGPAGPQGDAGAATTYTYRSAQSQQGSAAQAFCLPGEKVTGGGALVVGSGALTQNHPIADASGVIASGTIAVGWQAAATNWSPVQVYVVCAS